MVPRVNFALQDLRSRSFRRGNRGGPQRGRQRGWARPKKKTPMSRRPWILMNHQGVNAHHYWVSGVFGEVGCVWGAETPCMRLLCFGGIIMVKYLFINYLTQVVGSPNAGECRFPNSFYIVPPVPIPLYGETMVKTHSGTGYFWPTPMPGCEQWRPQAQVACHIGVIQ